jgi:hypothetical protein
MAASEFGCLKGDLMNYLEASNDASQRRAKIYQQIKQVLSAALGPNVDLDEEARIVIEIWQQSFGMFEELPKPQDPLQRLLCEYHKISEEISIEQFTTALKQTEKIAAETRTHVADAARLCAGQTDVVMRSLLLRFIPIVLPWLGQQRRRGSIELHAALERWFDDPSQ